MGRRKIKKHKAARISQLAVTVVICWSLGSNTGVGATNTSFPVHVALPSRVIKFPVTSETLPGNEQVLSSDDAELYRAIFAAQAKLDWKSADHGLKRLTDKSLVGHVLADRYQRRPATLEELRNWLASFAALPEAADIFEDAEDLPGARKVTLASPSNDVWSTGSTYGASVDFRTGPEGTPSLTSRHFAAKIDHNLHRGQPFLAKALLNAELQKRSVPAGELSEVKARIAAALFYEGKTDEARALAIEAAASNQNQLALWIGGLSAWKQNDMGASARSFVKLASEPDLTSQERSAASFWAYRALKRSGNKSEAIHYLNIAADQPHSFYGQLASELTGRETNASWQVPTLDRDNIKALSARPEGWRALALLQINRPDLAEDELRHLNPQGRRDLQEAMLAIADQAHMPSLALQLGGVAMNDNGKPYDAALYPVPPWQPVDGYHIDRALIYALMQRESQFDPAAVSGRGACGLMQVMPATARLIANDDTKECSGRMLDPVYNVGLGQTYVRRLAQEPMIGDNLLLLLAAYNGGPGKLAHWTEDINSKKDPLFFIESLPVRETRDYVQQVLTHYWMYRARLAQPETSLAQLARGEWPRYDLHDETAMNFQSLRASGYAVAAAR